MVTQAEDGARDGHGEVGPGALRRGLHILTLLRRSAGTPLSPAEIAATLGIPRPSAYRVLAILESEAYAVRTDDGKRYSIAAPADGLADDSSDFVRRMRPVMKRVAAEIGNAVFLVQRDGPELVCLHREIGTHPLQILSLDIGGRAPLGVGAAGVALLSLMTSQQVNQTLQQNAEAYVEYGHLHASTIRKLIENCRTRGYSVVGNYMLKGVLAVGICIRPGDSHPLTAISVTAPHARLPLSRQKEVAELMRREVAAAGF